MLIYQKVVTERVPTGTSLIPDVVRCISCSLRAGSLSALFALSSLSVLFASQRTRRAGENNGVRKLSHSSRREPARKSQVN